MNEASVKPRYRSSGEVENPDRDPYKDEIKKLGVKCNVVPVLFFDYINLDVLKMRLSSPDFYSGLVFTSPRAVKAVIKCCDSPQDLLKGWLGKPVFSVGETTEAELAKGLQIVSEGSEAGSASTLAEYIIENHTENFDQPLLMPCGEGRREELPKILEREGKMVEEVVVYNSYTHPSLSTSIGSLSKGSTSAAVFFSPSGVDATIPLLKEKGFNVNNLKWVAIGPTTEAHMRQLGIPVAYVCEKPKPTEVAKAISSLINEKKKELEEHLKPREGEVDRYQDNVELQGGIT